MHSAITVLKLRVVVAPSPPSPLALHCFPANSLLRSVLLRIREQGITILIVEHNMPLVMSTADAVLVLDKGKLLAAGTPSEVRNDPVVRKAYLETVG